MLKSPVTIRTPFQVVYILAKNCANFSSHSSFSTSIELGWYTAGGSGTRVGVFLCHGFPPRGFQDLCNSVYDRYVLCIEVEYPVATFQL